MKDIQPKVKEIKSKVKKIQPKVERKLHKLDATNQSTGRLGTQIALILRGKNKPEYQAHLDIGDIVEVYNIKLLKFTGKKLEQKVHIRYSGYQGGIKKTKIADLLKSNPGEILRHAVRDMLPPTRLRNNMMKRLIIK
ncbi:50S ribosomal protein L13 [Patescibacteria group bacterium]|nr:50S ribosomal protein L13 [Patescibacteria group bacterium]MBU0879254.1 50S ribosomal protein L13 [Patescibacteria group bacterium]MBU0880465.1 50S ribosomal protein L13 [Patescibacteria group bacterium]MBU0897996.1 50S ribosomal protein L13 [Patescibacteria group bacterium]MBU1062585.1 50S ribosomal protein L13 [Patescibacteria group bacterium]